MAGFSLPRPTVNSAETGSQPTDRAIPSRIFGRTEMCGERREGDNRITIWHWIEDGDAEGSACKRNYAFSPELTAISQMFVNGK